MKRSEWMKLYTIETVTDPDTGREKRVARYTGPTYHLNAAQRRKAVRTLWICSLAALAVFLTGGLTNSRGSHCLYVLPQFALCMLPLWYLLLAAFRLTRMKDIITQVDKVDGLELGQGAATALVILGALWALGEGIFLILNGTPTLMLDLLFLLGGVITVGAGWFSRKALGTLNAEKTV